MGRAVTGQRECKAADVLCNFRIQLLAPCCTSSLLFDSRKSGQTASSFKAAITHAPVHIETAKLIK